MSNYLCHCQPPNFYRPGNKNLTPNFQTGNLNYAPIRIDYIIDSCAVLNTGVSDKYKDDTKTLIPSQTKLN